MTFPCLHFDNGEMSKEELIMRQCAALVWSVHAPVWKVANGDKQEKQVVEKVRAVWPKD